MSALASALLAELSDADLDLLAERLAPRLDVSPPADGFLDVAGAAEFLACSRPAACMRSSRRGAFHIIATARACCSTGRSCASTCTAAGRSGRELPKRCPWASERQRYMAIRPYHFTGSEERMRMSPLSSDPQKRRKQIANLRPGRGAAGVGNRHATKHGAYAVIAQAELEAKARESFDALAEDTPVRDVDGGLPSHDSLVVRMLAEVLIRRERVRIEELRHGLEAPDGRMRGVVEYGLRLDAQALEYAKELGMTPASRAKLGLDLARTARTLEDEIREAGSAWDDVVDSKEAG